MPRTSLLLGTLLLGLTSTSNAPDASSQPLAFDRGASGLWHKLVKLSTTASVLHITAHPDDEHGGVLTLLSRGQGARVALLSLTRGEAGANAIGAELFDALGWIRAEELRLAGSYYGLDALYFTRLADYGYSKRLDEAEGKWSREAALGDMVYVIRKERPLVIVSRFQGTERDGHGQHQFAGVMSREAFSAAGDPERFAEQFEDGLEPWQPLKLYLGGFRENEEWTIAVDTGAYSPWLGDSFENVAREGLSFQRSQTSGRLRRVDGGFTRYYRRVASRVDAPEKERSFFDGIDVAVDNPALAAFDPRYPERVVPVLVRELSSARTVRRRQLVMDAIHAALGIELVAEAVPEGSAAEPRSPFAPRPTMGPAVPGQSFEVNVAFRNPSPVDVTVVRTSLAVPDEWSVEQLAAGMFRVHVREDATPWTPHIARASIAESRYAGSEGWFLGAPPPMAEAVVDYEVEGAHVTARAVVTRSEARLPYGYVARELTVVPKASVRVSPGVVLARDELELTVEIESHTGAGIEGDLALELPDGFSAEPASRHVSIGSGEGGEGGAEQFVFRVSAARSSSATLSGRFRAGAVLRTDSQSYRSSYAPIEHRDLETRYQVSTAEASVVAVPVTIPEGLRVGYVMGVGDNVPEGIAQLGASVELLSADTLARGQLDRYDAIVVGTRAYAVREVLRAHNARLLDYAERGGNLIVLYNTPEFQPREFAPYPGELPQRSEEISEEDAPVRIVATDADVLRWPNPITLADFDGWVEQRGSKFWSEWDGAYVAIVESHDAGQAPQRGGWLQARYGEGYYTYFAYALHRQLPYGVPGAYRILANLLSLAKAPEVH